MRILELIKIIVLGIIEGISEWMPISSTGHLLLFDAFISLNMSSDFKEMFMIVIQMGAIMAVVVLFFSKIFPFNVQGKNIYLRKDILVLWLKIVVACLPSLLGLLLDDYIESMFNTPLSIAIMLIGYGIIFIVISYCYKRKKFRVNNVNEITYKMAFIIGVFQLLAMIPGTSRSGITIIGAILVGVSVVAATEFTFYLAIPTIISAGIYKIMEYGLNFSNIEIVSLLIGVIVSFLVSLGTLKFLLNHLKKNDLKFFGYYRIVLGIIIIFVINII